MTDTATNNLRPGVNEFMDVFCDLVMLNVETSANARAVHAVSRILTEEVSEKLSESVRALVAEAHTKLSEKALEVLRQVDNPMAVLLATTESLSTSYRAQIIKITDAGDPGPSIEQFESYHANLLDATMELSTVLVKDFEKATGLCVLCGNDPSGEDHEDNIIALGYESNAETEKEDATD